MARAVEVEDLHFGFQPDVAEVLRGVDLVLSPGSRCILVGANGAGKSTLLQILAGRRLTRSKTRVLGNDVFFNTPDGVTYLGTEWAANPVVRSDLIVSNFLDSVGGYRHKRRRDRLLEILDVDLAWHMHAISDGERRRVQIVQGLMAPWQLLLLDEVTVDLDAMVRQALLDFLKEETVSRRATILYATHIFDGLDTFPTHICHLRLGATTTPAPIPWPIPLDISPTVAPPADVPASALVQMRDPDRSGSRLLALALAWLLEDREVRIRKEREGEEGFRSRGAKRRPSKNGVPTDSEAFYRKYDYSA